MYRHPSMSVDEFNNDYLTPLLDKASSENKLIFLTGDFNVDLLNYDFRLFINGKRLQPSTSIKYLGVLLDADLSWKSQINSVATKLKRANGALAKLRHFVPPSVLLLAYYAIFHSHLQYCCQIWGQPNSAFINRICVLQNCAMRLMAFKSPRDSASGLYANFGVLKFSDIVHLQNILFLDKLSRNEMPDAIQSTFAVDFSHTHPTRADNIGLLNLPLVETTSFANILSDIMLFFLGILFNLCYQPKFLILRILNPTLKNAL